MGAGRRIGDSNWMDLRRCLAQGGPLPASGQGQVLEGYGLAEMRVLLHCSKDASSDAIRGLFHEHGGWFGAPGSVAYLFKPVGLLSYPCVPWEPLAQLAFAAGAEEVLRCKGRIEVLTAPQDLAHVRAHVATHASPGPSELESYVTWRAHRIVPLAGELAREMLQLLRALGRREDVWSVYSNVEIPDEIVAEL